MQPRKCATGLLQDTKVLLFQDMGHRGHHLTAHSGAEVALTKALRVGLEVLSFTCFECF